MQSNLFFILMLMFNLSYAAFPPMVIKTLHIDYSLSSISWNSNVPILHARLINQLMCA